jgi:hypothetical protein
VALPVVPELSRQLGSKALGLAVMSEQPVASMADLLMSSIPPE